MRVNLRAKPAKISALEDALKCPGKLHPGRWDDLLSEYIGFYFFEKEAPRKSPVAPTPPQIIPVRAVAFDFDGTLTLRSSGETIWQSIWRQLGFPPSECAYLYGLFVQGKISHREWCRLTCSRFRERSLTQQHFLPTLILADLAF